MNKADYLVAGAIKQQAEKKVLLAEMEQTLEDLKIEGKARGAIWFHWFDQLKISTTKELLESYNKARSRAADASEAEHREDGGKSNDNNGARAGAEGEGKKEDVGVEQEDGEEAGAMLLALGYKDKMNVLIQTAFDAAMQVRNNGLFSEKNVLENGVPGCVVVAGDIVWNEAAYKKPWEKLVRDHLKLKEEDLEAATASGANLEGQEGEEEEDEQDLLALPLFGKIQTDILLGLDLNTQGLLAQMSPCRERKQDTDGLSRANRLLWENLKNRIQAERDKKKLAADQAAKREMKKAKKEVQAKATAKLTAQQGQGGKRHK
ncbi:unnamed protein product [Amoebophrya sp. A25]|nr:unnamed protein product [Amoebophrya sp. A25]|eukprot:GSA25T00003243001.1